MCRHLVYLGQPVPLSALLFDPPNSLARQSWAPRDMRGGGTVNADGFGIGWYGDESEPVRYRRDHPIWTDSTLPELAARTRCGAVLAAVRSATLGMPVAESAAAPFAEGPWMFSHNGVVRGWPDSLVPLADALPTRDLLTLDAPTDSALLWALVRHRLRGGASLSDAVAATVGDVLTLAPDSRLNLLLTDGRVAVATAVGHSLSWLAGGGAIVLSSEPLDDDPGWQPVPDGHLAIACAGQVEVWALDRTAPETTSAGPTA